MMSRILFTRRLMGSLVMALLALPGMSHAALVKVSPEVLDLFEGTTLTLRNLMRPPRGTCLAPLDQST